MAYNSELKQCPFCKTYLISDFCAGCAQSIFKIFSNTMKKKTNEQSPFNQVDNLVFQGGGVKGVAYLGALKALNQYNEKLLPNVKRVAGTSAGAILALYLGLNKDTKEIEELLSGSDYSVLLDDGEILTIKTSYWIILTKEKKFTSKDVLLKAMDFIGKLRGLDHDKLDEKLKQIFVEVSKYLSSKIGYAIRVLNEILGTWFYSFIASWLFGVFVPAKASQQPEQGTMDTANFMQQCQHCQEDALDNVEKLKKQLEEQGLLLKEKPSEPATSISTKSELDDDTTLIYAFTELLWTCLVSKSKDGLPTGLFAADKIKEELIIKPIRDSLKAIGKDKEYNAADVTFEELARMKKPNGQPAFRNFYVCAFNTLAYRTDIFSVDHTPHAVVSDAIRASMSIPLFFKSVEICEKPPGQAGHTPLRAYSCHNQKGVTIYYMDGGILDNYPIWMFDDLKYCLDGSIPKWDTNQKVNVQNPNTLGFKLLDIDRIDIYTRPYLNNLANKVKMVSENVNVGSYLAALKLLAKIEINEHEENAFAHRGDSYRTAYVYDCKISAISFKLDIEQKNNLISSGYKAVELYKDRAADSFKYEIGTVFQVESMTKEEEEKLEKAKRQKMLFYI